MYAHSSPHLKKFKRPDVLAHTCYNTSIVMWEAETRTGWRLADQPAWGVQGHKHPGSLESAGARGPQKPGEYRGTGTRAAWGAQGHNHRNDSFYFNKVGEADAGESS